MCGAGYYESDSEWRYEIRAMQNSGGDWAKECQGSGWNAYGERCPGYRDAVTPCVPCGNRATGAVDNSGGFVETEETDLMTMKTDNFPLTLVAHRGDKTIPVKNVRADSISAVGSKTEGYVDILFEVYGTDITGTIPMVDYWTTEAE